MATDKEIRAWESERKAAVAAHATAEAELRGRLAEARNRVQSGLWTLHGTASWIVDERPTVDVVVERLAARLAEVDDAQRANDAALGELAALPRPTVDGAGTTPVALRNFAGEGVVMCGMCGVPAAADMCCPNCRVAFAVPKGASS